MFTPAPTREDSAVSLKQKDDRAMRFGNFEVRPVGGAIGCLAMILFSIVLSLLLTLFVNLLLR
jgi:hypothetical protein